MIELALKTPSSATSELQRNRPGGGSHGASFPPIRPERQERLATWSASDRKWNGEAEGAAKSCCALHLNMAAMRLNR
jgi:hypothetical protein